MSKSNEMMRKIPPNFCLPYTHLNQFMPMFTAQFPNYPTNQPARIHYQQQQNLNQEEEIIDTSKIVRLKDCKPKDIVYITKNRVIQQNTIKVPLVSKPKQQIFKRPQIKSKQQTQEEQVRENEQLFNYEKLVKEKKDRKQKFLSDIERKINQVQKQAEELEYKFKQEKIQLKDIDDLQNQLNEKFKNQLVNEEVSKLQKQIEQRQMEEKNRKIEINMEINQIKRVIENEAELDQRIIDEADDVINRARGLKPKPAHIEKTKQKPPRPQKTITATVTSFNMTTKPK